MDAKCYRVFVKQYDIMIRNDEKESPYTLLRNACSGNVNAL